MQKQREPADSLDEPEYRHAETVDFRDQPAFPTLKHWRSEVYFCAQSLLGQ